LLAWATCWGSDHVDGPLTRCDPASDITDLYVFPGTASDSLVLVMDLYPLLPSKGHFRDDVSYEFLVRPVSLVGPGAPQTQPEPTVQIACRFETDGAHDPNRVSCSGPGLALSGPLNQVTADADHGARLFAGPRADPFFFNAEWANTASTKGRLPEPEEDNLMSRANVLSIVLELDYKRLGLGEPGPLAVAAQTMALAPGGASRRLDRVGRPEITNVSMAAHDGDPELRDDYNRLEPFTTDIAALAPYRERLIRNIGYYDGLDQRDDWTPEAAEALADLLVRDFLIFDASLPCTHSGYFEIESALLAGQTHSGCGGRHPNDDIMDRLYTLLVRHGAEPALRDGVDAPERPLEADFPYLTEPNRGLLAWLKSYLGEGKIRPCED
jgi:hypothetical protein